MTDSSVVSSQPTQRAVPYLCPFCGEEDLRPVAGGDVPGLTRGGWHCRGCLRVFSLSFHGVHTPLLVNEIRPAGTSLESEPS